MGHTKSMQTGAGGLLMLLLLTACSSGGQTRPAAKQSQPAAATATEQRVAADERASSYDPTDRMTSDRMRSDRMGSDRMAATERQTPDDRIGTGTTRSSDRVVPCADAKGDMTASSDCAPRTGVRDGDHDDEAGVVTACSYRLDDKGKVAYDDPECPAKNRRQMGSSYQNVRWTQESAFYDRHAGWAVQHARQAEMAANQGHIPEMRQHAELALDNAKEAQRAGDHPDLHEGIVSLRQALTMSTGGAAATASVRNARISLSHAAGIKTKDTKTVGDRDRERATRTGAAAPAGSRTVQGELIPTSNSSGTAGDHTYVLRDRDGGETPISLSPDMHKRVQAGDVVQAQIDSGGHVVAISKE